MKKYFIINIEAEETLFWSSTLGWTAFKTADAFTRAESESMVPPVGGLWVELIAG